MTWVPCVAELLDVGLFDSLTDAISGRPVSYLVVLGAAGGDVLLPVIPSETIVITAGVVAAQGGLSLWLLVAAAATGAFLGDTIAYWLGRSVGEPVVERVFRGPRARARVEWARCAIREHGPGMIVTGRFIPGGRTATTFAAGTLEMPWRRFLAADACAAVAWALYASLLGHLGGSTFEGSPWKSLALSLSLACLIAIGAEGWIRAGRSRGRHVVGGTGGS